MSNYKPTVMPHDESLHQQKDHGGAPGLHVPQNPENIDAFKTVSDVDAKDLNAKLQAADSARVDASAHHAAHSGHGLQQVSGDVPHEAHRDADDLNATLQAQDQARRFPHTAVPGPAIPGPGNLGAFEKTD